MAFGKVCIEWDQTQKGASFEDVEEEKILKL